MQDINSLKRFIFFQVIIALFFLLYLFSIYPNIKPTCVPQNPCAAAFGCECENNLCICNYIDEDDELKTIECEID